jgi:hypothetical protein
MVPAGARPVRAVLAGAGLHPDRVIYAEAGDELKFLCFARGPWSGAGAPVRSSRRRGGQGIGMSAGAFPFVVQPRFANATELQSLSILGMETPAVDRSSVRR